MLTEAEAKERWCPFARVVVRPTQEISGRQVVFQDCVSINRFEEADPGLPSGAKCIGSQCMAWRWAAEGGYGGRPGFCGLAGKPTA